MDVSTAAGDIYFLESNLALVYGSCGIELRLNARNLANIERARKTLEIIRDSDSKDRRFNVRFDDVLREIVFEPIKGEMVRSPEWMIFAPEKLAA
jgi:hypothetical protein